MNEYYQYYFKWVHFGATLAVLNEIGITHIDLSKSNVICSDENVVIIDYGGMPKIKIPKDIHLIAESFFTLFEWLSKEQRASVRFGYIQSAGLLGETVFDILRSEYNLTGIDYKEYKYNSFSDEYEYYISSFDVNEYNKWKELRKKLKYGNLHGAINIHQIKQWRYQRDNILILDESDQLKADKYHYKKHLIAALNDNNLGACFESLINLHGILIRELKLLPATGYLYICDLLYNQYKESFINSSIEKEYLDIFKKASEYYFANIDEIKLFPTTKYDVLTLDWIWDDLENGEIQLL